MATIFKFTLEPTDKQSILVQKGAQFLSVQMQHDRICVWAKVDPAADLEPFTFYIAGTGHPAPEGKFLGTVQMHDGRLVLHVFVKE